jgi:hypothetical protein
MLSRITVPLIAAAGLFFACGPRTQNVVGNAKTRTRGDTTVAAHVSVDTANGRVLFAIAIRNGTRRSVEISFPDSRTHDFTVLDSAGKQVWRWSEGRMFTQAMQNRLLGSRDSAVFDVAWDAAKPGNYTLVAELNSENHPVRQQVPFALH